MRGFRNPRRVLTGGLLLLAGVAAPSGSADAQGLPSRESVVAVGTVLDRSQEEPVPQATVRIEWEGTVADGETRPAFSTLTDEVGAFFFLNVPIGSWRLTVAMLGYQTLQESVVIDGSSPFTLSIRIAPEALELEGLVVSVRRNPWLQDRGFYDRQLRGLGIIYTGDELREFGLVQTTDLFRRIPSSTLLYRGSPTSPFVEFRRECPPDVVLDGVNMGINVRIDDMVSPDEVEGIEVYRGATNPGLFSSNPCGSILIWTLGSAARDGTAWSYRRGIIALGFIALGVLLAR
jgi:hypothetical protein